MIETLKTLVHLKYRQDLKAAGVSCVQYTQTTGDKTIDKKINIDSLCTQNHQELYSPRTNTSRGQSVLQ